MSHIALVARRRFTVLGVGLGVVGLLFGMGGASAATAHHHHRSLPPVFVHTTCHSEPASALHGPECVCALNLHLVK